MTYLPPPGRRPPYPSTGVPWPPYHGAGFPPQPPPPSPAGYGHGAPYGQPYAFHPYGPPKKSRRALWIALSVALAAVIAATVVIVIGVAGESDEAQIKSTIRHVAEAVDYGNLPKAVSYLCAEEARQVTERDDYDPKQGNTVQPLKRLPVNVTDVQITGEAATAQLSRPPQKPRTLHLKKEAGRWKLCDPGPA